MKTTALLVAAASLAIGCAAPHDGCPTSVVYEEPYNCKPEENCPATPHWVCPPEAESWMTYEPTVFHCRWRCVEFACQANPQDVLVEAGEDGSVSSVTYSDAQICP